MGQGQKIEEILDKLPQRDQIRDRLSENLREAKLLRQLLKLAEQREHVEEAQSK